MAEIAKYTFKTPAFWFCLTLTAGLLITGFFMPPMAKIDGSVLEGGAILLGFATLETAIKAIKRGVDAKVKAGNAELTVSNPDNIDDDE